MGPGAPSGLTFSITESSDETICSIPGVAVPSTVVNCASIHAFAACRARSYARRTREREATEREAAGSFVVQGARPSADWTGLTD